MSTGSNAKAGGRVPAVLAGGLVFGVLGLSALIGRRNAPDAEHPAIRRWYRRLDKPGFTPPDAAFGLVWPALETAMAVGGYRLLRSEQSPRRNASIVLWLFTTGMIGGWSHLFFRERALGASAAASGAMLATASAYVTTTGKVDRIAQAMGVPLVGWLGFATVLATSVWRRNTQVGSDA